MPKKANGYALDQHGAVKLSEQDEMFAQLVLDRQDLLTAAMRAGYPATEERGKELLARPDIMARVRQLQGAEHDDETWGVRYAGRDGRELVMTPRPPAELEGPVDYTQRKEWTRQDILDVQAQILQDAVNARNLTQANVAVRQLAQIAGHWVERSESENKNLNVELNADPEQLAQSLLAKLNAPRK